MTGDLVKSLRESGSRSEIELHEDREEAAARIEELEEKLLSATMDGYDMAKHGYRDRIEELEAENEKLRRGLELYKSERDRFKHTHPEMSGAYFLTGGHGPKDDNQMPQFVEVVPAYGCGWSMIYEDTGRTISYEGS